MEPKLHPYIATLKTRKQQDEFRDRFEAYLDEIDEPLLFPEGVTNDYIFAIFNNQGRWVGVRYYVNIDEKGDFFPTERKFGRS